MIKGRNEYIMNSRKKGILGVMSILEITLYVILVAVLSYFFLITMMKEIVFVIPLVLLTVLIYLYSMVYLKNKEKKESEISKDLQLYALTMIYHLQRGENVLNSLERTKKSVGQIVEQEIDVVIKHLNKSNAQLDTSNFRKYNFKSLDIFHHLLLLKYEKGGNSKEIFKNTHEYINMEIEKREKLKGKLNSVKVLLVFMIYLSLFIPLFFSLRASSFYERS